MSTLTEKLEALRQEMGQVTMAGGRELTGVEWASKLHALLADNAKEGEHELEQARRNWRHWQQRAEIAEERLAPDSGLRERLLIMQSARAVRDFCKHEGYPEEYSAKWQELTSLVDRLDMDFRRLDAALGGSAQTQRIMASVKLCTCEIITRGQMVDDPACPFHHPPAPDRVQIYADGKLISDAPSTPQPGNAPKGKEIIG